MLSLIASVVAAFVATYFVSRVLLVAFSALRGWQRVVAAHLVSLALLMAVTGFLKAYFVFFPVGETLVYVVPQILWLLLDNLRGLAREGAA